MTELNFVITFYGPFRVATGWAGDGFDVTFHKASPLPASTLKGLMRAAAVAMSLPTGLVHDVFGSPSNPSPWAWSDPEFSDFTIDDVPRGRLKIDPESGTAEEDLLQFGQIAWASSATFAISSLIRLADDILARHALVLRSSGAAIHALGNQRRRGLGWVHVSPERPLDIDDVSQIRTLREDSR